MILNHFTTHLHFFTFCISIERALYLKFDSNNLTMKKNAIITLVAFVIIIFTAFSFVPKQNTTIEQNQVCQEKFDPFTKQVELDFTENGGDNIEQQLFFNIRGRFNKSLTISQLFNSKLIKDFVSYYPSEWISEYVSVEMNFHVDGKEIVTQSKNDTLTKEQIEIINSLEINDDISIKVKYKSENAVSHEVEIREMEELSFMIVPEHQAMYVFGYDLLIQYLEENSLDKIPVSIQNNLDQLSIYFGINELGEIQNVRLEESSGNKEVDHLIIDLIQNMPAWDPAVNGDSIAVSQRFELTLGNKIVGC